MSVKRTTIRKSLFAMIAIAAALFAVIAGTGAASANGVYTEIKFAPNTNGTTVEGFVDNGRSDVYVLEARAGQQMTLSIHASDRNAEYTIAAPDGSRFLEESTWSQLWLPQSGRYYVTVHTKDYVGAAHYWLGTTIN